MTHSTPKYSIIIPVYNRPHEVDELLASLVLQRFKDFEIIIVEDGSTTPCQAVVNTYQHKLSIRYFYKSNSGPGPSRNFGYQQARGHYFVVFDSDCIIPSQYFESVEKSLAENNWDAWGGPDKAHQSFTPTQQAMGYTMASILTTGGIRGAKKKVGWFQPRSFNMGISRKVFEATTGFKFSRLAEDIEFSFRMKKGGFKIGLIPDAFVYHKRRTTFNQFYKQVFNFGRGRVQVGRVHAEAIKLTHWFPAVFVMWSALIPILFFVNDFLFAINLSAFAGYFLAIFLFALKTCRNIYVALLTIPAALLQLYGYGLGFLKESCRLKRR